ncbi:MAG: ABC transporter ATP-binding protein [Parcubacteria group bacterium]|jgi:ABC-type polysaccharide/polyol phosphate transport system ATPase subunit
MQNETAAKSKNTKPAETAIRVENLSKTFRIPHEKISTLRGAFVNLFRTNGYEEFNALDNVSFEVKKGEFFGIIGRNGSGKSTLLKILAGIYKPGKGKVKVNGLISPFLELGIGFNPELSGRDNIYLNASVLGLSQKQINEKFDDIVNFSELHRFIDQKVKNYSSGMQVRLAFSVAIHANRDILLMDEVLAVGDTNFQSKCMDEFRNYRNAGKTIILVTHDIETVRQYCDRAVLLRSGKIEMIGDSDKVGDKYIYQNMSDEEKRLLEEEKRQRIKAEKEAARLIREQKIAEQRQQTEEEKKQAEEEKKQEIEKIKQEEKEKNKPVKIIKIEFLNSEGIPVNAIKTHDKLEIKIYFDAANTFQKEVNIGVSIENREGQYLFGYNTLMDNYSPQINKGYISIVYPEVLLLSGNYFINVTIAKKDDGSTLDYQPRTRNFRVFSIGKENSYKGTFSLKHKWNQ